MDHLKRNLLVCLLTLVLTTFLTAGVAQAAALTGGTWSIVPSPNVGKDFNFLNGVAFVSATDVWTVGDYYGASNSSALIDHWNGTSWQSVPSPILAGGTLQGVAAVSATDIWAVGYYDGNLGTQTLIEHWNGSKWQVVSSPTSPGYLFGVAAISASDIWAVGSNGSQTLIEHWNGTSWQLVPSPSPGSSQNFLYSVARVPGDTSPWAVGYYRNSSNGPYQTLTEHWNGTSWQVISSPNVGSSYNQLRGVVAVSASNIWTVGEYTNNSNSSDTLIEHWNGTSWQVIPSPNPSGSVNNYLYGVAAVSATDIWAVGHYNTSSGSHTLTEHWNGTSWQIVHSPNHRSNTNELYGVTAVSATDVWAVGDYYNSTKHKYQTLTELYS